MTWRSVNASGAFPAWLHELTGKSGVYMIRRGGRIVYIGESHTAGLRKTLTRHFQHWTGRTSGYTCPRSGTEVAVMVTPAAGAVELQNRLIAEHRPPANTAAKPIQRLRARAAFDETTWRGAIASIAADAAAVVSSIDPFE